MKIFFILVLWSIVGIGQNNSSDSLWVLKYGKSDIVADSKKGYNAFYLDSLNESIGETNFFRQGFNEQSRLLFISNSDREEDGKCLVDSLNASNKPGNFLNSVQFFLLENNQFNHIKPDIDSLLEISVCRDYNLIETDSLHSKKQIDEFLDDLLLKKGVVPDVISSPFISDVSYLKKQYQKKPVYRTIVTYEEEELRNISWKEFPHLETCGVFRTSDSTLSPQKRGYMFSPDIYNFTDKNTKISGPKEFRAIKYQLDEELSYSLPLRDNFFNIANLRSKSTSTQVKLITDSIHGKTAYFNGNSSYIDIRSEQENKLEELSISAWVRPDLVNGSHSLVGKGEAFAAKIYDGRLQFTATGIKDHLTSKKVVEKGKWQHVGFVYVPKQKLYFYLNGELIEEVRASNIKQTDHALLIGTNLWGQYYSGAMSNLKIWDRALSDEEIEEVYLSKVENKEANSFLFAANWIWGPVTGIVFFTIWFLYRRKKAAKHDEQVLVRKPKPMFQRDFNKNSITLLNGFQVWNQDGNDITYKFSPKRRELLILILLFTIKEGGITSKKLSDILWPGFAQKNKKNNRSTQIKEIRKIFKDQITLEIIFIDKKWQLQVVDSAAIDLYDLNNILPDFLRSKKVYLTETEVMDVARLVSRGALLPQIEEEWLDSIKEDYNSRVLDLLSPFLENEALTSSERLEIIEAILTVDPLFETAISKKVSCLLREGRYGSAKEVVENYKKLYESFYYETINPEFMDLVK